MLESAHLAVSLDLNHSYFDVSVAGIRFANANRVIEETLRRLERCRAITAKPPPQQQFKQHIQLHTSAGLFSHTGNASRCALRTRNVGNVLDATDRQQDSGDR